MDIPGVCENDLGIEILSDGKLRIKAKRAWGTYSENHFENQENLKESTKQNT